MLKEGCIAAFYTQKGFFLKVYMTKIDKVKMSFVEKGKKGAGFDIYVDLTAFILLTEDILSGVLLQKIAQDTGDYPGAWTYVTGENGSKTLAIGKGQKGTLIQGRIKGETPKNAFIPVSYEDLRSMAIWFQLVAGLKPAAPDSFIWGLIKICKEAVAKNAAHFKESDTDEDLPQTSDFAPVSSEKEDGGEKNDRGTESVKNGHMDVLSGKFTATDVREMPNGDGKCVKLDDDTVVIFRDRFLNPSADRGRVEQFLSLVEKQTATPFQMNYIVQGDRKYFCDFAA